MKNRLITKVQNNRRNKKKLFCAFLTLGYPNLKATELLIAEFEKAGVDILELGFPFSDPLADGPTIQYSSEQALKKGVRVQDAFRLVKRLRGRGAKIPILFFTYLNPIYHYGLKRFVSDAKASGFDGVIVPDLTPEEEIDFQAECRKKGLAQVFLAAPTTENARALKIAKRSSGFIYFVSLRGVTGARKSLPLDIRGPLRALKRKSRNPILIGFGVSNAEQAKALCRLGDGVIVGSAIVDRIRGAGGRVAPAVQFIKKMVKGIQGV